ncbi:MAG: asparagine synthase-related protein, partial [Chloroflexi bacterium]|nr:asparagine synthase-related protein [Chloroflexota bacterium]
VMPYILEALDRAGAAFHIEPRYPFWDKRLVEFCLALPGEQKIRHGWTRMVMRRALGGTLPPEVQWRGGKSNLGYNFDRSLLAFEQSRMEEVIVRDPTSIEEYVDVNALREAHRRFVSQRLSNEGDVHAIWNAVTLSLWLQRTKLGVR